MAERTRARSGYAVAARALERAAQLTPAPERRVERAIAAADAFWLAGRGSRAEQLLTGALAEAHDPLLRADAEHLLGRLMHFRGDPLAAREILVAGALRVEREDRWTRRRPDGQRDALRAGSAGGPSSCARRRRAPRVSPRSAGVDRDARLSAMTGAALTICERLDAAEPYLRRSIELAAGAEPLVLAYAANSHGWLCEYARRPRRSPPGHWTPRRSREPRDRSPSRASCSRSTSARSASSTRPERCGRTRRAWARRRGQPQVGRVEPAPSGVHRGESRWR